MIYSPVAIMPLPVGHVLNSKHVNVNPLFSELNQKKKTQNSNTVLYQCCLNQLGELLQQANTTQQQSMVLEMTVAVSFMTDDRNSFQLPNSQTGIV